MTRDRSEGGRCRWRLFLCLHSLRDGTVSHGSIVGPGYSPDRPEADAGPEDSDIGEAIAIVISRGRPVSCGSVVNPGNARGWPRVRGFDGRWRYRRRRRRHSRRRRVDRNFCRSKPGLYHGRPRVRRNSGRWRYQRSRPRYSLPNPR